MHKKRIKTELNLTYAALALTLLFTGLALRPVITQAVQATERGYYGTMAEFVLFLFLALTLIYGSVVYQVARFGYLKRLRAHQPAPEESLEKLLWDRTSYPPTVTVLVPSYKEEVRTIEQTLLSAALQPYPNRRVVLLLDDPPASQDPEDQRKRVAARATVKRLSAALDGLAGPFTAAHWSFVTRADEDFDPAREAHLLADLNLAAAAGLEQWARTYEHVSADHTDRFFAERILRNPARAYRERAESLRADSTLDLERTSLEYKRLASLFQVDLSVFERKRYLNLSHESNKAMNLNSYISLLGKKFKEIVTPSGTSLQEIGSGDPHSDSSLSIPEAEYIVTLDADSLLMPGYIATLVHRLEQNPRAAVAQTPYTAIPGAPGILERVAGATTDIQYLIHQGSAHFSAAYWVGANAVLRKRALDHICSETLESGCTVRRYIQDRTVIEDTESTLDLVERFWEVDNYPERLAYSATPPDFGAVLVQRRRWANGGLIILPKLLRYLRRAPSWRKAKEGFLRVHYLFSLAGVNFALLLIFVYPFDKEVSNLWLPLTALPYFLLYSRDLVFAGRRFYDVLPVYAFNLMLVPVQLGGVLASLHQALTQHKSAFARTPKVADRTSAPKRYLAAELSLLVILGVGAVTDSVAGNRLQAVLGFMNAGFFVYVLTAFIGWRACAKDLFGWRQ